jgi:hypothetical protein
MDQTKPRMSKAKATKMTKAKLRYGHFRRDDFRTLYTYCPDCEREVAVDVGINAVMRGRDPGDVPSGARMERAQVRLLEDALITHLMDPYHDEEA